MFARAVGCSREPTECRVAEKRPAYRRDVAHYGKKRKNRKKGVASRFRDRKKEKEVGEPRT